MEMRTFLLCKQKALEVFFHSNASFFVFSLEKEVCGKHLDEVS